MTVLLEKVLRGLNSAVESSLILAAGLMFAACSPSETDPGSEGGVTLASGSPCPRKDPIETPPGGVVNLTENQGLCRIVFRETGITLRADPNGAHPDPGRSIVRDSKGRFYTSGAAGFPFDIALWDTDGTFLRSFGGEGDGPGEMGHEGSLVLKIDSRDRLHVKDARRMWTIFEPDQTYVRRQPSRALGELAFMGGGDVILDDGRAIAGNAAMPPDSAFHFRLVDSTGVLLTSFGEKDRTVLDPYPFTDRRLAYGGGDSFWAGPPAYNGHSPDGYTLEEWSIDGQLLRTLKREVPWLPVAWPPPPPAIDHRTHRTTAPRPNPPSITRLHMDADGILLVIVRAPTERWVDPTEPGLSEEERAVMTETRIEAIDTRSGVVLASERLIGMEQAQARNYLPRTRFVALSSEENLLPIVRITEYNLVTE